jgi:aldose sugar dehydrogenase
MSIRVTITTATIMALALVVQPQAQRTAMPTPGSPVTLTGAGKPIRVALAAGGLVNPWDITFLPGSGDMLVTESAGRLRLVRNGTLVSQALWEVPPPGGRDVLHGVVVHPDFAQNRFVYVSYAKKNGDKITAAVSRGRLENDRLVEVKEIFVADAWETAANAVNGRMIFGPDRTLYLTIGDRDSKVLSDDNSIRIQAQNLTNHIGKVLRLTDDGGVPKDNPFVGRADAKPEIFTYGNRNPIGLAWHPDTGELWVSDIGPLGGDRLDILRAGRNYGWPLVSMGRNYTGSLVSDQPWWRPGIEMPRMVWVPSISPSSLTFYTGDKFPEWRGNVFVGALTAQHLQRVVIRSGGGGGQAEQRQPMLTELGARVRDVEQGPDGFLYVATEVAYGNGKPDGAVLRIEPSN